jgi:16S rRNA pseudouridine516 synthase
MTKLRLDRLLANLGYGTRRTVQNLVNNKAVVLNGEVLTKAEQHIALTPDLPNRLSVEGEPLDPLPGLHLIMHKPLGYTCSRSDGEGKLVYELLPERWAMREPALSTIGRLDKETSGLLLFTDDGALLHKITSPKHKVLKRYLATLARPLTGREAALFATGELMLEGEKKPLLPAEIEVHSPTSATVTISEGRYHQVRRMFAAAGNEVKALHRLSMGKLSLPLDLEAGKYRLATTDELSQIFG